MAENWHRPGLPKKPLSATATRVGHIGVVVWETKQPGKKSKVTQHTVCSEIDLRHTKILSSSHVNTDEV